MKIYFGVDIGGTYIKFGAFLQGDILWKKWSVPTDLSEQGERIIPAIADEVKKCAASFSKEKEEPVEISGIGLGIPGPVTKDGFVRNCVNLHWNAFYPKEELKKYFPECKICVENDANVAALGEYYFGKGKTRERDENGKLEKTCNCMMLVTLGTGVGGGIVLDGKIVTSLRGMVGEIGHISLDMKEKERCSCGNTGCLNQIASATGLVRVMKRYLKETEEPSVLRNMKHFTAKEICDSAKAGDAMAQKCVEYSMGLLGKGLAVCSHILDPDLFVISGGVTKAGDVILDAIRKGYQKEIFLAEKGAEIQLSELRSEAGMMGAYAMVRENV